MPLHRSPSARSPNDIRYLFDGSLLFDYVLWSFFKQEMRKEMLALSSKSERPDHVWKFKPLPGEPKPGEIPATALSPQTQEKEGTNGWSSWFGR